MSYAVNVLLYRLVDYYISCLALLDMTTDHNPSWVGEGRVILMSILKVHVHHLLYTTSQNAWDIKFC